MGVAACAVGQADEDPAPAGVEVNSKKWPKPTPDAHPADGGPATDAPSPPSDGGGGGGGSDGGGNGDGGGGSDGDGGGGSDSGSGGSGSGGGGFIDACQLPGMVKATFNPTGSFDAYDEGVTAALSLPFPFSFYGVAQTKFWFTPNGQLGFGSTPGGSTFGQVTCPLPDARFAAPTVLVYSVDLVGRLDGDAGVCYATTGAAPSRKLVVTWKDSFFYESWLTSHVTFSATLNEGTGVIDVALDRVDAPSLPAYETGVASVLGTQSGGAGAAFSCYQPQAPEGTVVHYPL